MIGLYLHHVHIEEVHRACCGEGAMGRTADVAAVDGGGGRGGRGSRGRVTRVARGGRWEAVIPVSALLLRRLNTISAPPSPCPSAEFVLAVASDDGTEEATVEQEEEEEEEEEEENDVGRAGDDGM
jgi:hypothetical protein